MGAGAEGLGFLMAVAPNRRLTAVVDLNPAKTGHFLPVTGHEVVGPRTLDDHDVTTVIITNPVYRREIEAALTDLGLSAEVISAH